MPSLAKQHNWLIHCIINAALKRAIKEYATGKLLDVGCGEKPYREMTRLYVTQHTGVDQAESPHGVSAIDILATAYSIPQETESYDTILCTDVLEHLEEPCAAVAEAFRLLRSGGHAIYTVPLFWHLHEEPRDFYRFTKYGLRYLFEKNGFAIVEINALTGFCVTFVQEFVYFLYRFRKGGPINPLWWIIPPLGHLAQTMAYLINRVERTEMFSCEYLLIARKP